MPTPFIVKQTRTLADGTTTTYRVWRARWTDTDGTHKTVGLGNADIVTKRDATAAMLAKMKQQERPTAERITVRQWCDDCLAAASIDKAAKTVADYERTHAMLIESWGTRPLRSITAHDAERWMNAIEGGAYTKRRYAIIAAAWFARALKMPKASKPYLRESPFAGVEMPTPGETADVRYVTVAERRKIIESVPDSNWRALVALTGLCGLRFEEAMHVTPADINHESRSIVVRLREERKGQGGGTKQGTRIVPLSPAAYQIIRERIESMPEGAETVVDAASTRPRRDGKPQHATDVLRRFMEQAGIVGVSKPFHDLRKAVADDWSLLHGCELSAKWCGHTVQVALKHYRQRSSNDIGLVTKQGNPREELERAYTELDKWASESVANMVQIAQSR